MLIEANVLPLSQTANVCSGAAVGKQTTLRQWFECLRNRPVRVSQAAKPEKVFSTDSDVKRDLKNPRWRPRREMSIAHPV